MQFVEPTSLLASRYATLFSESISTSAFYTEEMGVDQHDEQKVIKIEKYRDEFVQNYKAGKIDRKTHPLMRRYGDPECDPNPFEEMAKVAAVCCIHSCITASCGGDPKSGVGCRFDFPKKTLKYTVPAIMEVSAG